MTRIVLLAQTIIDYLCRYSDKTHELFGRYGLETGKKHELDFDLINLILTESDIIFSDIGGCVTNTALGLNNLGIATYVGYVFCRDKRGDFFKKGLDSKEYIHQVILGFGINTGVVVTYVKDGGSVEKSIFNLGCANKLDPAVDINFLLGNDSCVYVSTRSFYDEDSSGIVILKNAKVRSSKVIVNAGGVEFISKKKLEEILKVSNGVIANVQEARSIEKKVGQTIQELSAYDTWFIVTSEEKPTLLYLNGKQELSVSLVGCNEEIVNTLGAGDAFAAGFLKEISEKNDFEKAIKSGNLYAQEIIRKQEFH